MKCFEKFLGEKNEHFKISIANEESPSKFMKKFHPAYTSLYLEFIYIIQLGLIS